MTNESGKTGYILCHTQATTNRVFDLLRTFYDNLPEDNVPNIKPSLEKNNRSELSFSKLQTNYAVGTAGSSEVGRGFTIQYFHGSEVAFWNNGKQIKAGIMNAIPDVEDTALLS